MPLTYAQTAEPTGEIIWLLRPAFGRIPDGATRFTLAVELRCTVRSGRLTECAAVGQSAEGFAESAIEAAARAHVAAEDTLGAATEGRVIIVPIGFPIPVAIDPPPAPPSAPVITTPVWLEQPEAADFDRLYPARARAERVEGRASLDCIVGSDGRLACTILSEEPEGFGFGDATLRLASEYRLAPLTPEGAISAGGRVRRTVRWVLPE